MPSARVEQALSRRAGAVQRRESLAKHRRGRGDDHEGRGVDTLNQRIMYGFFGSKRICILRYTRQLSPLHKNVAGQGIARAAARDDRVTRRRYDAYHSDFTRCRCFWILMVNCRG
jgi:hypothetical protein